MDMKNKPSKPRTAARAYRDSQGELVTVLHPPERSHKARGEVKHG